MNDLPREISEELLLKVTPPNLFQLCSVNKRYHQICKKDLFWKKYYKLWVDLNNEIHKELKVDGQWRKAFLKNYSYEMEIGFSAVQKNDLWKIYEIDLKYPIPEAHYNYYCLSREDNILVCVPVLVQELPGTSPNVTHEITSEMTLIDEKLKIRGIHTRVLTGNPNIPGMGQDIRTREADLISIDVVSYPFHHRIIIDIDNVPLLGYGDDIYERTKRHSNAETLPNLGKETFELDSGEWIFRESESTTLKIPDKLYLKEMGVELIVPI